jgi:hypothetical protein
MKSGDDFIAESFVPETLAMDDGGETLLLSSAGSTYAFANPKPGYEHRGELRCSDAQ